MNLLAKEITENENGNYKDEETMQSEDQDLENCRSAHEVTQTFYRSNTYFLAYLTKTVMKIGVAFALLAWMVVKSTPLTEMGNELYCDVHGYGYECSGHPREFYMYVLYIAVVFLLAFLILCAYNMLWVTFPQLGTLSRYVITVKKIQSILIIISLTTRNGRIHYYMS